MKNTELTTEQKQTIGNLSLLTISGIASVIENNWYPIYFGAIPYLHTMRSLFTIDDAYGADSARSIVTYFLCNAQTWRGPIAKAVKAELNARIKSKH